MFLIFWRGAPVAVLPLVSATSDSIATSISRYIFPYLFHTLTTTLYTPVSPPFTVDSEEPWEVFQAHISKLEGQLHEIVVQKEVEIMAALKTGKKGGYILG